MMEEALLLSLSPDLWIDQITATTTDLIVHLGSTQPASHCPLCGHASEQVHSRYRRVEAFVPCGLRPVCLSLEARKFFCRTPNCPRKIFDSASPRLGAALGPHDESLAFGPAGARIGNRGRRRRMASSAASGGG
jgi:hypothetical protein